MGLPASQLAWLSCGAMRRTWEAQAGEHRPGAQEHRVADNVEALFADALPALSGAREFVS